MKNVDIDQVKVLFNPKVQTNILFALSSAGFSEIYKRMRRTFPEIYENKEETLSSYVIGEHPRADNIFCLLDGTHWDFLTENLPYPNRKIAAFVLQNESMIFSFERHNPGVIGFFCSKDSISKTCERPNQKCFFEDTFFDQKSVEAKNLYLWESYQTPYLAYKPRGERQNFIVVSDGLFQEEIVDSPWLPLYNNILDYSDAVIMVPFEEYLVMLDSEFSYQLVVKEETEKRKVCLENFNKSFFNLKPSL